MRGRCPRAPGIYRAWARMTLGPAGGCCRPAIPALGRRSGRIPAEPYPPPRFCQYTSDCFSVVENDVEIILDRDRRTRYK